MRKHVLICTFLFLLIYPLLADDRLDTIRYGIDSEVITLIDNLIEEEENAYSDELLEIFEETVNDKLREKIISYFTALESDEAVEPVFSNLKERFDQDLSYDLLSVSVHYLENRQNEEISSFIADELFTSRDDRISILAAGALAESGDAKHSTVLLKELEERNLPDNKRAAIVSALGKLGDDGAIEMLIELLGDEGEEKSIRWRSVTALGEIGTEESLEAIRSVLADSDPILRSKAVAALSGFDGEAAEQSLIQALRDPFWRVRVSAAKSLGNLEIRDAVDILIYKAEKDPDIRNVRNAAIEALAKIGGGKAEGFLVDHYISDKSPMQTRSSAISVLLEHNPAQAAAAIDKLFHDKIAEENSAIVMETARQLSTMKSDRLEGLYKRMLEQTDRQELVLYALRGIRINRMRDLEGDVKALDDEDLPAAIRQNAQHVLESFAEEEDEEGE